MSQNPSERASGESCRGQLVCREGQTPTAAGGDRAYHTQGLGVGELVAMRADRLVLAAALLGVAAAQVAIQGMP